MKYFALLSCLFLLFSCSEKEKSDKELLDLDTKALHESLNTEKVIAYKFCKIMLRAANDPDSTSAANKQFRKELLANVRRFEKLQKTGDLSVKEYLSMFSDYQKMRSYIISTDEDVFRTLLESNGKHKKLKGKKKLIRESKEHAFLSAFVVLSKDLGKEVSLYECAETDPGKLDDSELKSLLMFYRGMLFFEKGFYYLSEDEAGRNIEWLEKNPKVQLPVTRMAFGWTGLKNDQTHTAFLAMNYLFRGFDRAMMTREKDDKRSVEDFRIFLEKMNQLGISNELTLSVEAYVCLKKGETDKAIIALEKLKLSSNLSQAEKDVITKSIAYLEKNKGHSGIIEDLYDSIFIGKIATGYTINKVESMNWNSFMVKNHIPYSGALQSTMKTISTVSGKIEKLENGETLKETAKEAKEEGGNLLDKAKGLFD